MARIVLAMSGGVDSSAAAYLLRQAGHEVIGLFMKHGVAESATACQSTGATNAAAHGTATGSTFNLPIVSLPGEPQHGCCTAADAADARRVADALDIPFYALNFDEQFGRIVDYFVDEYIAGRTPNPCVVCNNWLKFGKLCDYADSVGAEFIATGHYAQLDAGPRPVLRRGIDPSKDQSYVLFGVARERLQRIMLPIGGYRKSEVRVIARQAGLRVADKRDSQEICFVTDNDYAGFVERRLQSTGHDVLDRGGELVTVEGDIVGRHDGVQHFTIGQRKGLGVAFGEPRYVVRIDADTRRVVIGTREQLGRTRFTANRANWLIDAPESPFECAVQIRYQSRAVPARVTPLADGRLDFELHEPATGVAPGQAAVCYAGDQVLGGGWIE
ncbi:MAG: tRNA 2-thiouridine(34) synthase MnmA [Planctomycetes bacterium]|nr:tRNA 2-thiouridine(34) synthase MnmA [Planctomycetota bacterium]